MTSWIAGVFDANSRSPHQRLRDLARRRSLGFQEAGALSLVVDGPAGTPGPRPLWSLRGLLAGDLDPDELLSGEDAAVLERLRALRGEFSLVAWDRAAGRGLVARDHLGLQAVYYRRSGSTLYFAAELPDLLDLLERQPSPDRLALLGFIADRLPAADETAYEGVHRLGPGHALILDDGRWSLRQYWAPTWNSPLEGSTGEVAEEVGASIRQAVARRLPEERPVAVLLSGGLDSSTLAGMATQLRPGGVRAYSNVFPSYPAVDESAWIDILRTELRMDGVRSVVRDDGLVAGALEHIRDWRVPFGSYAGTRITTLLRQAAADGAGAVFAGEGADELFGPRTFLLADHLRAGRLPSAARLLPFLPGDRRPSRQMLTYGVQQAVEGALPHALQRQPWMQRREAPDFLSRSSIRFLSHEDDPWAWKRGSGPLWHRWLTWLIMQMEPGVSDLSRGLGGSCGIPMRHPFMDVDVVELALRVPPEMTFTRLYKGILRRAIQGTVPDAVRLRPDKTRFGHVIVGTLAGPDRALLEQLLCHGTPEIGAFASREAVKALVQGGPERYKHGPFPWATAVWRLANAECWLREQSSPGFVAQILDGGQVSRPSFPVLEAGFRAAA